MKLFDCYCSFGRTPVVQSRFASTASELCNELEYCGIDQALVFHSAQRFSSPVLGNELVIEETKGFPKLHPTWAILPHQTGEQLPPDKFVEQMKEKGIKALYAFTEEHGYLFDEIVFGELFEEMVSRSIPLLVRSTWPAIYGVLKQFPKLTLICVGHGPHGHDRYFRPLIEKFPNFYIDTSSYLQDGGIEDFCEKYGGDRMVFATGYPQNCIGGPVMRLACAVIKDSYKESIGSGNITRILEGVRL